MAALLISSLASFFADEQKSLTRGENHYKSNHVESFSYSDGVLRGEIHASMKKKVYKVTVSNGLEDALFPHYLSPQSCFKNIFDSNLTCSVISSLLKLHVYR